MKNITLLIYLMIYVNDSETSKVVDMTASIANSVYKSNIVTTVVWWDRDQGVTDFLKTFNGSSVIVPISKSKSGKILNIQQSIGYNQTVFFATAPEQFAYWAKVLNKNIVIPIRVILAITTPIIHQDELKKYTRTSWKHDVADIVVISTNEDEENVTLWTYYPYRSGVCGDYTPTLLNYSTDAKKLFPKKFSNFHQCPIRTTALHYPPYLEIIYENNTIVDITGMDGNASMAILKSLNATMEITSVTFTSTLSPVGNSTTSSAFHDLVTRKVDLSIPSSLINPKRYSVAQISPGIQIANIKWVGPNRREIYAWAKVLLPFYTNITPFLCLSFFVFISVTVLANRLKTKSKHSVIFQSFALFLGQDVKFMTKSSLVNSLFTLWIWFTLIVRIGYQGDLVDGLRKIILEPPLGTLEQALKVVDGYGGVEVLREYYSDSPLLKNYTVLQFHDLTDVIKQIYEGKRFVLIGDYILVQMSNKPLQVLNEMSFRYQGCVYMRPAWPASKEVSARIQEFLENGLIVKVHRDFSHMWKVRNKFSDRDDVIIEPLGMGILAALFYGLGIIWIICFVIFIIEIIYYRYMQVIISKRYANTFRR